MSEYGTNQKVVKENVFEILEAFEEARNSDKYLLLRYWELCDNIDLQNDFESQFGRATSPESITRARRTIQDGGRGLFIPTDEEVLKKRRMLQEEARVHHAGGEN